MANEPAPALPETERVTARDAWELLKLPGLIAAITAVSTWLIWYYTSTPCSPELAERTGCNAAAIARYINVDIYGRILTYSAITGAAGGVWNYDMFTKMRAAIAAERSRADEAVKQLAEYRQQVDEERRQEREAFFEMLVEERERAAEERRRSDENQQAFMATLSEITAQMAQLVQQRNGDNGNGH